MALNKKYQTQTEQLVTYSFTDALVGEGGLSLYLVDLSGSYTMTTNPFYSRNGFITSTQNFDVVMNRNLTIGNTGIFNLPVLIMYPGAVTASAGNTQYEFRIEHIRDGVTTVLTAGNDNFTWPDTLNGTIPSYFKMLSWSIDFSTLTKLKIGDTLRARVIMVAPPANTILYAGCDPNGRVDLGTKNGTTGVKPDWDTTVAELRVPIIVEKS